jgi:hypothetical protein
MNLLAAESVIASIREKLRYTSVSPIKRTIATNSAIMEVLKPR